MLIDISDVLQICVHELGRTYLKFTQALCINIPSVGEHFINLHDTNFFYFSFCYDSKIEYYFIKIKIFQYYFIFYIKCIKYIL